MTLYDKLRDEVNNHRDFWNYYGQDFGKVLESENDARQFMYQYFEYGAKQYALSTWMGTDNDFIKRRSLHTVNVFFIGAFLQRMIDANLTIKSETRDNYPYSYIWYLTCLAHDLGYVYETNSGGYISISSSNTRRYLRWPNNRWDMLYRSRKMWYMDHGINIMYLCPGFGSAYRGGGYIQNMLNSLKGHVKYNNGTEIRKPWYSEKTKNNYFFYRVYEMRKLDHGIIGADELFTRLLVNYVTEYSTMTSENSFPLSFNEFENERGLHFCCEQFKIFAYIADCIAVHNMYKAEEKTVAAYEDYALDALMPDRFRVISYAENPLLFVLCVADTLEPSKKFPNYSNREILQLISMEYDSERNLLCVGVDEELYASKEGKDYVANLEKLEEWCRITIRVNVRNIRRTS